ncbi:MAG: GIY-YIG nuclease family protein [Candidatus Doudnabacteria bacterium]|nr:GIY-YIG nuclease family protein [Candidatus Doudnabacteria bacterium]
MFNVYILISKKDNKRYIGSTNDLVRRLAEHENGLVSSTKGRRPLELLYTEEFKSEREARLREHYFKTHKGYNELEKILRGGVCR